MKFVRSLSMLAFLVCGLASPTRASDSPGAVFALTNAASGNAVVMYARGGDGSLTPAGSFPTGGLGSGGGISSQGAIIVSDDQRMVFAVNPGSNSISSFIIRPDGLELAGTSLSGGTNPTSVTYQQGRLYVLNAGVPNNVTGFTVNRKGQITPIAGATRPLSGASTNPAQVGISDDGSALVVTERASNRISVYAIEDDGQLTGPIVYPSAGPVPFGFAIDKRNTLFVSEAGAGGGASSYRIGAGAALEVVSGMQMTGQRAACWTMVTPNGRFGYVTNAGTGNISGFAIGADGSASLLNSDGVTAVTGGNPTDVALSHNGQYMYVRVGALSEIAVFAVNADGSLSVLPPAIGTPALAGLAAY
jgi:6-phosphogluconolactonase (cycloisomerase 2 family)